MKIEKQVVTSGKLLDWLKKSFTEIGKGAADVIKDTGANSENIKQRSDGSVIGTIFPEDDTLQPYLFKLDNPVAIDDNTFRMNLSFQSPDGRVYPNVEQIIYSYDEDRYPEDQSPEDGPACINSDDWINIQNKFETQVMKRFPVSATVTVAARRAIYAGTSIIELEGVDTNCNYDDTLDCIDDFLNSEDVCNALSEESCCYELVPSENELAIESIETLELPAPESALKQIVSELLALQHIITAIKLTRQCNKFDTSLCDTVWWTTESLISAISDISEQRCYNLSEFIEPIQQYDAPVIGYDLLPILASHLQSIIDSIEIVRCIADYSEFQTTLQKVQDEYISILDGIECNYNLSADEYSF